MSEFDSEIGKSHENLVTDIENLATENLTMDQVSNTCHVCNETKSEVKCQGSLSSIFITDFAACNKIYCPDHKYQAKNCELDICQSCGPFYE